MNSVNLCTDLITPNVATKLIPAFTAAYSMALDAANDIDFLGGSLRNQILPHLKNWAVEYELQRRSELGLLPFDCTVVPNTRGNHKHIELRKNGFVLTVSQTPSIKSMPRECIFRNQHCMDGQIALAGFDSEYNDHDIYAILTHGHGTSAPSFILCGIPNPSMSAWAQHVNLLTMEKSISIVDDFPINDDIKLDFRNQINEYLEHES